MSDDRPSIAELQKLIGRWPARWRPAIGEEGEWDGFWWCADKDGLEDRVSADTSEDYANDLATTVAELRNATPVLLEIAAAALALREQEQVTAKARYRVYSVLNRKAVPTDETYAAIDVEDRKLKQCRDAYDAALAKARR